MVIKKALVNSNNRFALFVDTQIVKETEKQIVTETITEIVDGEEVVTEIEVEKDVETGVELEVIDGYTLKDGEYLISEQLELISTFKKPMWDKTTWIESVTEEELNRINWNKNIIDNVSNNSTNVSNEALIILLGGELDE